MFKTFPEFSKLTFSDREEYEEFIKDLPPINDLAFASLMTMWSTLDTAKVAVLNGNLVISYWLPGADTHSGLALVGTNLIDESLCTIFDYLRHDGQEARVVNIPQFVVDHVRYPEMFHFDIKAGDEDFVVALKRLAVLSDQPFYRRARIKKFIKDSGNLEIKSIDLSSNSHRKLLLDSTAKWPKKGLNNIGKFEQEGLELCIRHAAELNVGCLGLFEDGEPIIYDLYSLLPQSKCVLALHSRLDYSIPYIFDYMTYAFMGWWLDKGAEYMSIHSDMGLLKIRAIQITLRPTKFFRKYTIRPAE